MQIYKEKQALGELIKTFKNEGFSIGFVPTMGALHEGHISLVKQALASSDKVITSIFVNPTQFDNAGDLEKYPRTFEKDINQLQGLDQNIIIFSPDPSDIYGNDVSPEHFSFDGLEYEMEGKFRKGHFDGVGTIVKKLFEIVQPDKAFFGEKDFQQLQIIRKLTEKHNWDIEIIGCPIDRESNGLARSSRNERLTPENRQKAAFIYKVLQQVKKEFGTKSVLEVSEKVKNKFGKNPDLKLEYFEIANEATLKSATKPINGEKYRAFIAAYSGDVRLIDNIALN